MTGTNATEPDIMYFRSTHYGTVDPGTPDTPGTPGTPSNSPLPKSGDYMPLAIAALITAIDLFTGFERTLAPIADDTEMAKPTRPVPFPADEQ